MDVLGEERGSISQPAKLYSLLTDLALTPFSKVYTGLRCVNELGTIGSPLWVWHISFDPYSLA